MRRLRDKSSLINRFLFIALIALTGLAGLVSLVFRPSNRSNQKTESRWSISKSDSTSTSVTTTPNEALSEQLVEAYGKLPLSFEANEGQTDAQVKFFSRGSGYGLFLTQTEAVMVLKKPSARGAIKERFASPAHMEVRESEPKRAVLRMTLVGANPAPRAEGLEELLGKSNYFIGNDPQKWRTNVSTYAKVEYSEIYPGVSLVYYGNPSELEYDFLVAPGTDPRVIRLGFRGAERIQVDANGDLVLSTPIGEVRQRKPNIYQQIENARREITGGYVLDSNHRVSFQVGEYDSRRPLVIDPVLVYSTYLGGNNTSFADAITIDSEGNAYLAGDTDATNFPTTSGAIQPSASSPPYDGFVAKLNATGTALLYSTYLGGSDYDYAYAISVDSNGNAYVSGKTYSANFPITPGAFQTTYTFGSFVTKLNATGTALVYSTFVNQVFIWAVKVDSTGNAYITGNGNATGTPCMGTNKLGGNAFVGKLNSSGTAFLYFTCFGGATGDDTGRSLALDADGNIYVAGDTFSTDFPVTSDALQKTFGGSPYDGFVAKLNSTGTTLLYATYFGGSVNDEIRGIVIDTSGHAYVAGLTDSPNFPISSGAFQTNFGGGRSDAFVAKLNPTGNAIIYSTYLGGSGDDYINVVGIAVDATGNSYVTGQTSSSNFPITPNAFQHFFGGGNSDAFVTKLNATGAALIYSTYLGGDHNDVGNSIVIDSSNNAYVTGWTVSSNFPTTPGAFQTVPVFGAFAAKIAEPPSQLQMLLDQSGPGPDQAAALDSMLFLRDPFLVVNRANVLERGSDQNTRVIVFVANLQLGPGEASSSVRLNLVDSTNYNYDIAAEDVRSVSNSNLTQVIFRLPDNLSLGICSIKVNAHGLASNSATIRIGN